MPVKKSILKSETLLFLSLIVLTILVSVFVVKNFVGNLYYLKWKDSPQKDEESISILEEKTVKLIPSKSSSFYELGRYYHKKAYTAVSREEQREMFRQAEQFLIKAISMQPGNSYYLAEYARIAGSRGGMDMAISYFEKSISLSKTDATIHKIYARWSLYRARTVFLVEDLEFLVKMYNNPEEVVPFYEEQIIGGVMVKTFVDIAEREWDEALRLGVPGSRGLYRNLGDLYMMVRRPDKAIDNYKRAGDNIRLINSYFIKRDLASLFSVVKSIIDTKNRIFWSRWDEIRKLLDKIAIVDRNSYQAYYWLGKGYYQQNMFEEAIGNLEKSTALKPNHVDGHLFLAKSYEAVRKTDSSIHEYTEVLKIKPGHKEANELLGRALGNKL